MRCMRTKWKMKERGRAWVQDWVKIINKEVEKVVLESWYTATMALVKQQTPFIVSTYAFGHTAYIATHKIIIVMIIVWLSTAQSWLNRLIFYLPFVPDFNIYFIVCWVCACECVEYKWRFSFNLKLIFIAVPFVLKSKKERNQQQHSDQLLQVYFFIFIARLFFFCIQNIESMCIHSPHSHSYIRTLSWNKYGRARTQYPIQCNAIQSECNGSVFDHSHTHTCLA